MSKPRYGQVSAGERYGRLLVLERTPSPGARWRCSCDCGAEKLVASHDLRAGKVQSCGCYDRERRLGARNPMFKHGASETPLFRVWRGMLDRCRNPNCAGFRNYGGRGIAVCDRWLEFTAFAADMAGSYSPGLTIERVDVNGPYEPGNCIWTPRPRQAVNRRNTPWVEFRGTRMAFADAWRAAGQVVPISTAWVRFNRYGWSLERALTSPRLFARRARGADRCWRGHPVDPERRAKPCPACASLSSAKWRAKRSLEAGHQPGAF